MAKHVCAATLVAKGRWDRKETSCLIGANFSGHICCEWKASGVMFNKSNFSKCDLSRSKLAYAVFQNAKLVGTKFDGADLSGACFHGADVRGASFEGAMLIGVCSLEFFASEKAKISKVEDQITRLKTWLTARAIYLTQIEYQGKYRSEFFQGCDKLDELNKSLTRLKEDLAEKQRAKGLQEEVSFISVW